MKNDDERPKFELRDTLREYVMSCRFCRCTNPPTQARCTGCCLLNWQPR